MRVQATDIYRKLASSYPQRVSWRLKLAKLEQQANRTSEATTILRALISDLPYDSAAYEALAVLTARDNPSEAVSIARQLGEHEENALAARLLEGDVLVIAGKLDDALRLFLSTAKSGNAPQAYISTVRLLDRMKRAPAADQLLSEALHKYPRSPAVLDFAAKRALAQSKTTKAIELLRQLVATTPGNPVALNDLSWTLTEARNTEGMAFAIAAANLRPYDAGILDTLGMAQALAGQKEAASATLRRAINLAPEVPVFRLHLAQVLNSSGDTASAAELLKQIDKEKSALSKTDLATFERLRQPKP